MAQSGSELSQGPKKTSRLQGERQHVEVTLKIAVESACPVGTLNDEMLLIGVIPNADRCVSEFLAKNIGETCEEISRKGGDCDCSDSGTESEDEAVVRATFESEEPCICTVFKKHGCSPRIVGREMGIIVINSYLPNRETLRLLIQDLKQISPHVQATQIQEVKTTNESTNRAAIDMNDLTAAQQKCLKVALENDYFDDPRGISQAELALELGISPSAVSRRLRSIEKRTFEQVKSEIEML